MLRPAMLYRVAAVFWRLAALAGCTALAACVIFPDRHEQIVTAGIDGVVTDRGVPVAGAVLTMNSVVNREACSEPLQRIVSDSSGRFSFAQTTRQARLRVITLAPSSDNFYIGICIERGDAPVPLYTDQVWGALPDTYQLDCDVGREVTESGYCRPTVTGYNGLYSLRLPGSGTPDAEADSTGGNR